MGGREQSRQIVIYFRIGSDNNVSIFVGIFYSSIGRRAGFVNADVKLRLKPA